MTGCRLSAGVNTANFLELGAQLQYLKGLAGWAHVDVMDGTFCPQLTVGPSFIKAVASSGVLVDAHLMVNEPRRFLEDIARARAGIITIHVESTKYLYQTLREMSQLQSEGPFLRGLALNPGTSLATLEPVLDLVDMVLVLAIEPGWSGQSPAANTAQRVDAVRKMAAGTGRDVLVGVDGGVTKKNASTVASWGPDIIVSGSAIYDGGDVAANLQEILQSINNPDAPASEW
jgi:ribulose-phosphate 3-epimerase